MCKKTALPVGYCPRVVTNAMVRRERMVRRIRDRVTVGPDGEVVDEEAQDEVPQSLGQRIRTRTFSGMSQLRQAAGRRISSAPISRSRAMTEMSSPAPALVRSNTTASATARATPAVQPPSTAGRREWARQRAERMLGSRRAPVDPDAEEAERTPRWRKALQGLFPGR